MRINKYITLFMALVVTSLSLEAQQAKVFFDTNVDCLNNTYCATIKTQAINETEFAVGTSSILLNYNKEALEFVSYESHNFNEKTTGQFGSETINLYDEHAYDALIPGLLNTTMTLTIPGFGEPTVKSNQAMDVATVCFDIKEMGANSGLKFHHKHTNFNKGGTADIQVIESMDMIHAQETIECENSAAVTSVDDAIANSHLNALSVTPNPFKEAINLNINAGENDDLTIQLFDVKGQLIKTENANISAGENGLRFEASELPSGLYLLEIKGQAFEASMKLLKE